MLASQMNNSTIMGISGYVTVMGMQNSWNENGKNFRLIGGIKQINGEYPPIDFNIIRDPKTHHITQIKVSSHAILELLKKGPNTEIAPEVVSDALAAEMSYTFSLDTENKPVFSDFKLNYTNLIPNL